MFSLWLLFYLTSLLLHPSDLPPPNLRDSEQQICLFSLAMDNTCKLHFPRAFYKILEFYSHLVYNTGTATSSGRLYFVNSMSFHLQRYNQHCYFQSAKHLESEGENQRNLRSPTSFLHYTWLILMNYGWVRKKKTLVGKMKPEGEPLIRDPSP